jgi:hypothetical protein
VDWQSVVIGFSFCLLNIRDISCFIAFIFHNASSLYFGAGNEEHHHEGIQLSSPLQDKE